MADGIDFVIPWVDDTDPAWQRERATYAPVSDDDNGTTSNRYRDWGLLPYWFRGVEQFAPWVHKVFFVTWGHLPSWLDTSHPKLRIVRHEEYIPEECRPTFNSNVIEMFLNRVPDLGERFVLFNDDVFLTAPTTPDDFFRGGLPCETAMLGRINSDKPDDVFPHTTINNFGIINAHFDKKTVVRSQRSKFFHRSYGIRNVAKSLLEVPYINFSCFNNAHICSSYLKSTFDEVWAQEGDRLARMGTNRFRSMSDYSHILMKAWQICKGQFVPRSMSWGRDFELGIDEGYCEAVENGSYRCVCINDSDTSIDFERTRAKLQESFERLLPEPSSYERPE